MAGKPEYYDGTTWKKLNELTLTGVVKGSGDGTINTTFSYPFKLNNNLIEEVATPLNDTDGANKKYVDDAVLANSPIVTLNGSVEGSGQGTINTTLSNVQNMKGDTLFFNWHTLNNCTIDNEIAVPENDRVAVLQDRSVFTSQGKYLILGRRDYVDDRDSNNTMLFRSETFVARDANSEVIFNFYDLINTYSQNSWDHYLNFNTRMYLNGNRILGVGAPDADTDGANKKYVDDAILVHQPTITLNGAVEGSGKGTVSTVLSNTQSMNGNTLTFDWSTVRDCSIYNRAVVNPEHKIIDIHYYSQLVAEDKTINIFNRDSYNYQDANNLSAYRHVMFREGEVATSYYSLNSEYIAGKWRHSMGLFHDIIMRGNQIKEVGLPVDARDAANKEYVDNAISVNEPTTTLTGAVTGSGKGTINTTFTYPLRLNNNLIKEVATPLNDTDGANKKYVDDAISVNEPTTTLIGAVTGSGVGTVNTILSNTQDMNEDVLTFAWTGLGLNKELIHDVGHSVDTSSFTSTVGTGNDTWSIKTTFNPLVPFGVIPASSIAVDNSIFGLNMGYDLINLERKESTTALSYNLDINIPITFNDNVIVEGDLITTGEIKLSEDVTASDLIKRIEAIEKKLGIKA